MSGIRLTFLTVAVLAVPACRERESGKKPSANSHFEREAQPAPSRFAATGWPEDAGPVVVLPGNRPQDIQLVLPELTDNSLTDTSSFELDSLPDASVQLFSREKSVAFATIMGGGSEEILRGCKTWPTAQIGKPINKSWRLGLAANVAEEIPLSGWGAGFLADSIRAAKDAIQIALTARGDSMFRGIPFFLRYLYRFDLGKSRAVVAGAVRRINTEANVREEHVLVVAERAEGASTYAAGYRETRMGGEDEVQVPEIIVAVRLGENRRPALFVSLDYGDGSRLLLLERIAPARWIVRWQSAYSGC